MTDIDICDNCNTEMKRTENKEDIFYTCLECGQQNRLPKMYEKMYEKNLKRNLSGKPEKKSSLQKIFKK